jgi:hypothetical protein
MKVSELAAYLGLWILCGANIRTLDFQ